jgi:hypothetical protein
VESSPEKYRVSGQLGRELALGGTTESRKIQSQTKTAC